MGTVVVDASVLLGFLDPEDPHHAATTRALRRARAARDRIVLPATALAEILVGASRLGTDAVRTTEAFVDAAVDAVHDIDRAVARASAALRAGHRSLRLPDALVIATGAVLEADSVLTADRRWSRVDRRVRVIR